MSPGLTRRPTCMVPADARAEVVVLRDGVEVASWPLRCADGRVDLGAVNTLARLQLEARRKGCTVWLRHACPDLLELLELVGLLQVIRQPEGLEQGGVEEVVVPDDPVA
ncbi:MAG: STAS domain-containing protein [Acidimicrobiales bacterium]|nr:STAS domain-containing protein [Acidimicrobiales bacterium]